jgi:hypothetical protein
LQVVQHLFDWEAPKEEPTEQEMVFLLTTQFSVRVDLDRKVAEHIKRVDDHGVVSSESVGLWCPQRLQTHPRSQCVTADTALPEALAKTNTGTSKIL